MKLDMRQRVFGVCFLLLICSYECISINTQIKQSLHAHNTFNTAHQLTKAVEVVQNHMDIVNGQFDPNEILDVINGPLFDQAMNSNLDMITSKHVDSFLETYESSKGMEKQPIGHILKHHLALKHQLHSAVPSAHVAAHLGPHHEHKKHSKCHGICIDTSENSGVACSVKTLIGKCPGNKHIQCCPGKVERKSGETGAKKMDSVDESVGTLKVMFAKASTNRDMDALLAGKSDLLFEVVVGDKLKGTRKAQVSMVHDDTHEVDFTKEADRTYTFRNVPRDATFSIKLFDDDLIGYEQIGHTDLFKAGKNLKVNTLFKYKSEACPSGTKLKKLGGGKQVCNAGSITFSTKFIPGSVAVPGKENILELKKNVKGFPNYDLESYERKGTTGERIKARFQGAIGGLLVGLLFGLPDLFKDASVKEAGRTFFTDAGESFQPVFQQFKVFQEKMGSELKSGLKLSSIKIFLKELMQIMKSLVNFFVTLYKKNVLWKMLFMMIGMMLVMLVAGVALAAAGVPAVAMTVVNILFSVPYIWDQIKVIKPNFVTCKNQVDGCTLQNLHKGFGAIGRIIGTITVEMLMIGGFVKLVHQVKKVMQKNKPGMLKNLDVDGLLKLKKKAASKNSKAAKQVVDDMPCKICGRRRRLFQASCCLYRGSNKANGNVITDKKELEYIRSQKKHAEWKERQGKTFDNDPETRDILLGRGKKNKLIEGLGDHVKYPDQALNPNLFKQKIVAPEGKVYKWNTVVKGKIERYQKDWANYRKYQSWGGEKPRPLQLTDWDGATAALKKDAKLGVTPPLEAIVPGAPGSRWKLADELTGIVTDQNYKGALDGRGYPTKWDPKVFGDRLDITWERGTMPTAKQLKEYKALMGSKAAAKVEKLVDFNALVGKVDDPLNILTKHADEARSFADDAIESYLAKCKKSNYKPSSDSISQNYREALEQYRDLKIKKGVVKGMNGWGTRTSNVIYQPTPQVPVSRL